MLEKGAKYWAAALGLLAAVAAGGAVWRYSGTVQQAAAPVSSSGSVSPVPLANAPLAAKPEVAASAPPQSAGPQVSPSPAPTKPSASADLALAKPAPASGTPQVSTQKDALAPQFDIVRVEPTGEAVMAGHAAPKAKVAVTDRGQIVAETQADETGQFVAVPPVFAPGAHSFGLTATAPDGKAVQSAKLVAIEVPPPVKPAGKVKAAAPAAVATLNATATPAPVVATPAPVQAAPQTSPASPAAAAPRAAATTPPAANASQASAAASQSPAAKAAEPRVAKIEQPAGAITPRVAVAEITVEDKGHLVANGAAPPGAFLRLYLNGSFLANVTANADGRWSLTVERGMKGGAYAIRADEIDQARDTVIARAEAPFNYPAEVAEQTISVKNPEPASSPPSTAPTIAIPAPAKLSTPASEPQKAILAEKPAGLPETPAGPRVAAASPDIAAPEGAPAPPQPAVAIAAPTGAAHAIVRNIDTTKVVRGDSLWRISSHHYGNGVRYKLIFAANSSQIRDPRLIYPGQIFVLPQPAPF
jgi:nucleoid-associated protein YgaU